MKCMYYTVGINNREKPVFFKILLITYVEVLNWEDKYFLYYIIGFFSITVSLENDHTLIESRVWYSFK